MSMGLVGRKCGMMQIFTDSGVAVPVTVIEVQPNRVTQIKTTDSKDGYTAVQITAGSRRAVRVTKPMAGHFAKAGVEAGSLLKEFRLSAPEELGSLKAGDVLDVQSFSVGQKVDVRALTKGKGYAGTVKRHHFRTQDATHGNSLSHRAPGSIGQRQTPGRVMPGKRMSGHLGDVYRTVQNQEIVKVDVARNLILIKGVVPGAPGGAVVITQSVKARAVKGE